MSTSKVGICNIALAMLGADSIRSFDESNKRARMADVFYDFTRDYLMSKFDWPFARKYKQLSALDTTGMTVPEGYYPYQLPNDCHTPRDLGPLGTNSKWRIMSNVLYCETDSTSDIDIYLYYTAKEVDIDKYPPVFSNLLALGVAVKMCIPITQDKALSKSLAEQFIIEQQNAWESEANVGEDYKPYDEDPDNDPFVYPDGVVSTS